MAVILRVNIYATPASIPGNALTVSITSQVGSSTVPEGGYHYFCVTAEETDV